MNMHSYSISFTGRSIAQVYTAYSLLADRYSCRVQCVKRLVNGLYNGYFLVCRDIVAVYYDTSYIRNQEQRRYSAIRLLGDQVKSLGNLYIAGTLKRYHGMTAGNIPVDILRMQKKKFELTRSLKKQ